MLIEVKETHPPKAANRSGTVITMDGQKFDCWPNIMRTIRVGMRYDVETSTNDRGYTSISKATPAGTAAAGFAREGAANVPGAAPPSNEVEFVARVLSAGILKGEVTWTKQGLADATLMLRRLYKFADFDNEQQSFREAAE